MRVGAGGRSCSRSATPASSANASRRRLSPSTEAYDRGAKFDHYGHVESLREYVLVSTDRHAVDHYRRGEGRTWLLTVVRGADAMLRLPSIDATIPLAELYENLDLVAPEGLEEPSPHPPAAER